MADLSLTERIEQLAPARRALLEQHLRAQGALPDADAPGQLVAYVTLRDTVTPAALQEHMARQLPSYMVPSAIIPLDTLPRTPNGKVDRQRLPAPETIGPASDGTATPPRTESERFLASLWMSLLKKTSLGIHDNFFDLGGDSMMSIHLFARIEKHLGRRLPVAALFEHPTIAQLATLLDDADWTHTWTSLVPIQPQGHLPPLFCIHAGGGHVLFYNDLARQFAPDRPVYGLQPLGLEGSHAPLTRVEDMAAHYLREIRMVQPTGPYHLIGQCASNGICLEMAQQLHTTGEAAGLVCILDSGLPSPETAYVVDTLLEAGARQAVRPQPGTNGAWDAAGHFLRTKARRLRKRIARQHLRWRSPQQQAIGRVQDALRAANMAYKPRPYPGKITLLRSRDFSANPDKDYHVEEWQALAQGGFERHVLPVHHLTMALPPEVSNLARQLNACLAAAEAA